MTFAFVIMSKSSPRNLTHRIGGHAPKLGLGNRWFFFGLFYFDKKANEIDEAQSL